MSTKTRKAITIIIVVAVILIIVLAALSGFITNILWFMDLGYLPVFLTQLFTQLWIGIPVFVGLFLVGYFYLKAINRGYHKRLIVAEEKLGPKGQNRLSLVLAAFSSLIITAQATSSIWMDALQFKNSTNFGIKDPIFGLDVSFYTFRLNFIHDLNDTIIVGIVVFALLTFIYYGILLSVLPPKAIPVDADDPEDELGARRKQQQQQPKKPSPFMEALMRSFGIDPEMVETNAQARPEPQSSGGGHFKELIYVASKQIIVLGILFFLMLGVSFFLQQFDLLYTRTEVLYGAGYTDIHVNLWMLRILMVLSVFAAVFFAVGVGRKRVKTTFMIPVIMIGVGIVGAITGAVVQNLVVDPDAINKEGPYLSYNIAFTQQAYDLANVKIQNFPANNDLTGADILNNSDTIKNIRINDYDPAKTFYNSTQSIRQYYDFNDVNVDRYMINGEYTQVFIAAREIDETKVPQEWLNLHLKYTHGYGITLSRVDQVTASGQPDMLIKNIPPESQVKEIKITRPEIYFGELTNQYIVVGTDEKEFDYPQGESNVLTTYQAADSGIHMTPFNRLMFAIREQSMKLLVGANINSNSRIIINRNIEQRVQEIMPYLSYSDPYMVTANGKLYWIIDAYTTNSNYPYSEPYSTGSTTNYIRNSVKVVIDAYTGDTGYYLVNGNDPVANTLSKIFPVLFKPISQMPAGVQQHIRYPATMLTIQANIYARYHVKDVGVFYQGEDRWAIANEKVGASDQEVPMTPNYYIMQLPGEKTAEFVNSVPYTPATKNNMISLLIARNDGANYGKLVLLQLPKGKTVMGPSQIDAQIAQDTTISQDFALWQNSGSEYRRGNMFVIPIKDSIMYVEPIYLQANNSSMPEVKRVVVYYNDKIAYQSTLAGALDEMFGDGVGDGASTPPGGSDADQSGGGSGGGGSGGGSSGSGSSVGMSQQDLIAAAEGAYNDAQNALKNGDWAAYGQAQAALGNYLSQLAGGSTTAPTGVGVTSNAAAPSADGVTSETAAPTGVGVTSNATDTPVASDSTAADMTAQ
ncbi:MAG: UPF0182 family protein [Clostridiales bacterium]|nr:UPF0182 family protein [Clostridiales bacterium]